MKRVRMITSMSGNDYDLPYGTELAVGEALDEKRYLLDLNTAARWLAQGVVEEVHGALSEPEPPQITTTVVDRPQTAVVGRRRRTT